MGGARLYCKEGLYKLNQKECLDIEFNNDSEGYELRDRYFKGSSSSKSITTFQNVQKKDCFRGFIEFLSFTTLQKRDPSLHAYFAILNSPSFFENAGQLWSNTTR